ncbi:MULTISPECIES: DoxX family protein [unclassified Myxococcus]|uniref:DoxX family protein n=1 Tax=unclassified Myxococcus TaxID=2648731 RepID=UPI001CBCBF0C|nr:MULTISPECIES: DoxX family protein [unclassified Myxococcus]MBZ4396578.1 DoxX family protein [Myxococcus sp. AS-1-15]MBZ4411714.1 DoxX family protein [Myxococcus sp. XM-1-1-1]
MKLKVAYWVVTALVSLSAAGSAFMYLTDAPPMVAAFEHLGYPAYFRTMLGIAKVLGVLALWAPLPRTLREWAYAGFAIDFVAAAVSHTAMGDPAGKSAVPVAMFVLLITSHQLWHRVSSGAGVESVAQVRAAGA